MYMNKTLFDPKFLLFNNFTECTGSKSEDSCVIIQEFSSNCANQARRYGRAGINGEEDSIPVLRLHIGDRTGASDNGTVGDIRLRR